MVSSEETKTDDDYNSNRKKKDQNPEKVEWG